MSDKWAERYRIVKTAFWWKLIVGDCGTLYGRFYSRNEAEHMAALLLREFRNGMFVGAERAEAERDAALDRAESAEASERPLLQVRDELLAENEALRAALQRIAYTQHDICSPPLKSIEETMRDIAQAVLARREQVHPNGGIPAESQPDPTWAAFKRRGEKV